jgi:predicted GNAT superfamily acetyltransferase
MVVDAVQDEVTSGARVAAKQALALAGVEVRTARSPADMAEVRRVLDEVFQLLPGESEASVDLLVALAHTGQYVVLAHDLTVADRPVLATSLGFFCAPQERRLHSHATAVLPEARSRQVGWALKLHQRSWALDHGLGAITWTFDPLVRRNVWFNLAKLGALPIADEEDFYGAIPDAINAGDESDRFVVHWALRSSRVERACAGSAAVWSAAAVDASDAGGNGDVDPVAVLLDVDAKQTPVRLAVPATARHRLVRIPADVEAMRLSDPALALRWRRELRAVLAEARAEGLDVLGIVREGNYVLGAPVSDHTGEREEPR